MNKRYRALRGVLLCFFIALVSACAGGSKMLKEPLPTPELTHSLASAEDPNIAAALNWVTINNGPGAWAKNAWWDEYHLTMTNTSDQPLELVSLTLVDALAKEVDSLSDRKALVKQSRKVVRRFKDADLKVKPGAGGTGLVLAGTGALVVGSAAAAAIAAAEVTTVLFSLGTASYSAPLALTAGATAAVVAAPVLIVSGVVKGSRNRRVNRRIEETQSDFPVVLDAGASADLQVFFPVTPGPTSLHLQYRRADNEYLLEVDTQDALGQLHFGN